MEILARNVYLHYKYIKARKKSTQRTKKKLLYENWFFSFCLSFKNAPSDIQKTMSNPKIRKDCQDNKRQRIFESTEQPLTC